MGATLCRVERPFRRRLNASVSSAGRWLRVAGRWSRVVGRWSRVTGRQSQVNGRRPMVAGRGSRVAGHGARFRRSGAKLSSRGTSVTLTFGRCGTSSMSPAAFRPPPFPMRGPMSIGTDCRNRGKSCPCQLEDNAFRRTCEQCDFSVRARLDLLRANVKSGTAFRFLGATNIAPDACCIDVRSLPCR